MWKARTHTLTRTICRTKIANFTGGALIKNFLTRFDRTFGRASAP